MVGCDKPHYSRGWCHNHYRHWKLYGDPTGSHSGVSRFLHEVAVTFSSEDCLIWPFARTNGYGHLVVDGVDHRAHRLVCQLVHGDPPTPTDEAAHSCGKGHLGCVNPRHLSWKTRVENQGDRIYHGTSNRGSRHGLHKLTEADVLQIRRLLPSVSQTEIARQFEVDPSTINNIKSGKNWGWLP